MRGIESVGCGLYLHVPFCAGKCGYCAFYSQAAPSVAMIDRYLERMIDELGRRCAEIPGAAFASVYMGGGTPSTLSQAQFARLADAVRSTPGYRPGAEWTVEINPGEVDLAWLAPLCDLGVTRVSLGVQSMDDVTLQAVGRRHTVADVEQAVGWLRAASMPSVGLDLICGLPGVGEAQWEQTLARVVALEPDHVSVYALSIEPGTAFHARVQAGERLLTSDARLCEGLDRAREYLAEHGFDQIETSNFARPGQACEHNLNVWRGGDFLGVGCAASSRIGLTRWSNAADLAAYLAAPDGGAVPREFERVDPQTDVEERLMFAFRLTEGVDLPDFAARCGEAGAALLPHWERELQVLASDGLVERVAGRWVATERGRHFADQIAMGLLGSG